MEVPYSTVELVASSVPGERLLSLHNVTVICCNPIPSIGLGIAFFGRAPGANSGLLKTTVTLMRLNAVEPVEKDCASGPSEITE